MLGLLCARTPKPWILSSLSTSSAFHHHHHYYYYLSSLSATSINVFNRFLGNPVVNLDDRRRKIRSFHSGVIAGGLKVEEAAVSVWHPILPEASGRGDWRRDCLLPTAGVVHQPRQRGEGSWNVAWDARPARWIHRLNLACLLFGVCAFLAPVDWNNFLKSHTKVPALESETAAVAVKEIKETVACQSDGSGVSVDGQESSIDSTPNYRVTGVLPDGRCLFRALAHGACLQSGTEAPDEKRQRELADELRAQVVDELLKRRKETEWFIEGDFDAYVKRLQQPYVWGGEPEILMASHVLKTAIAVYMRDEGSASLTKIANYGEEYEQEKEFFRTSKEENNLAASSSSATWSLSSDAGSSSSSSSKLFPATASSSSCSSRAAAGFSKKKASMSSHSSRGLRDVLGTKSSVGTSSSFSAFVFSTREDKGAAPSEISWSKSKRLIPRKDRRNSKNSSSMLSNSRAGTRVVATRNASFLSNVNEDSEMRVLEPSVNMFAFSMQETKPSHSSAHGTSRFTLSRTKKADQVPAAETTMFAFDGNLSRFNPPTFPVSSSSAATTASATYSFSSQSFSTVDPVVSCARAVLQDCIRTRKMEQSTARKRSIEGCFDGDGGENHGFGWQYESVSKPWEYGVMSPGSCSSDDELRQLSSVNPSFCTDKIERGCNSKLAKEEIYRQILVGDNDFSSSPDFQCFSPLIEEKGIPIEVRYQLPLALGTANETSKECTICQLRYGIGDHIVTLPCQHFFHACCVDKWLWNHTSCPLCRSEVTLDQEAEARDSKHNFTACPPMDRERIRRQMRSSAQPTGFRPVVPVESDQLELEVSRMAIDEDSEVEDEPSYVVCPTPHFATSAQDK